MKWKVMIASLFFATCLNSHASINDSLEKNFSGDYVASTKCVLGHFGNDIRISFAPSEDGHNKVSIIIENIRP